MSVRKKIVFRVAAAALGLLIGVVATLAVYHVRWEQRRASADLSHVNLALLVQAMEIVPVADGCVQDYPLGFDQPAELPSGPSAEAVVMARWRLEESRSLCQASAVWIMDSAEAAHEMWVIQKSEWGSDVLPDQVDSAANTELARLRPVCLSGYAENPCGAAVVMRVGRLVIWSMAFAETESLADTQLRLWFWNFLGFLQINQDVASGA